MHTQGSQVSPSVISAFAYIAHLAAVQQQQQQQLLPVPQRLTPPLSHRAARVKQVLTGWRRRRPGPLPPVTLAASRLHVGQLLGSGGVGDVYEGEYEGLPVTVKVGVGKL